MTNGGISLMCWVLLGDHILGSQGASSSTVSIADSPFAIVCLSLCLRVQYQGVRDPISLESLSLCFSVQSSLSLIDVSSRFEHNCLVSSTVPIGFKLDQAKTFGSRSGVFLGRQLSVCLVPITKKY